MHRTLHYLLSVQDLPQAKSGASPIKAVYAIFQQLIPVTCKSALTSFPVPVKTTLTGLSANHSNTPFRCKAILPCFVNISIFRTISTPANATKCSHSNVMPQKFTHTTPVISVRFVNHKSRQCLSTSYSYTGT